MLDPHTSLGIAQTIFYLPMVPIAIFLLRRNGSIRPRMAWYPLIPFTLMRLAGGPVIIALEKNPSSLGLIIAATVLLNIGVVPLLITDTGLVRVILMDNYSHNPQSHRIMVGLRVSFLAAAVLLAAGGGVGGSDEESLRHIGRILTLVGYGIFAGILVVITAMQLFFYQKQETLHRSSGVILRYSLLASPFIAVRTVYGLLQAIFSGTDTLVWNPVYGNTVAFAFMGLLMEYIALCIYLYGGFSIPPRRDLPSASDGEVNLRK